MTILPRNSNMNMTRLKSGRAAQEYGVGRVCAHPGCNNFLSRYNPDDICSSHTVIRLPPTTLPPLQSLKLCSVCKEYKPATAMYFRRRRKNLESQCRECVNAKKRALRAKDNVKKNGRRCSTCGELKPNTAEYFRRFDVAFTAQCKACSAKKKRATALLKYEKEVGRKCTTCGEIKPATAQYFRLRDVGLEAQCKECSNKKRAFVKAQKQQEKLDSLTMRKCPICGEIKPLDAVHWRKYRDSENLSSVCYSCLRERWKEAANSSRKRRATETATVQV